MPELQKKQLYKITFSSSSQNTSPKLKWLCLFYMGGLNTLLLLKVKYIFTSQEVHCSPHTHMQFLKLYTCQGFYVPFFLPSCPDSCGKRESLFPLSHHWLCFFSYRSLSTSTFLNCMRRWAVQRYGILFDWKVSTVVKMVIISWSARCFPHNPFSSFQLFHFLSKSVWSLQSLGHIKVTESWLRIHFTLPVSWFSNSMTSSWCESDRGKGMEAFYATKVAEARVSLSQEKQEANVFSIPSCYFLPESEFYFFLQFLWIKQLQLLS